jgi:predicted  nucleic acid-binding Zn-ribbon protein
MHPDIEKLLQLDETDREIARLRAEVAALPGRVATIQSKLAGIQTQIEGVRKSLKDIEAARRKHEGDISTLRQKISKYRDQMLVVKTNQEYKALGNEIQFTEQEISRIEDRILEGMLAVEGGDAQLKTLEAEQKRQQAEIDREKTEARSRTEQDERRLSELTPTREQLRQAITPDILRHYDRVLKARGTAIAEARDQYCQTCHVMMRPQVFQDVMNGASIVTCDSCGRIFYYKPPEESATPAGSAPSSESQPAPVAEASDAS